MQPSLVAGMRRMINTKLQPTRVKYVAPEDKIKMWRIVRGDEVRLICNNAALAASTKATWKKRTSYSPIFRMQYLDTQTSFMTLVVGGDMNNNHTSQMCVYPLHQNIGFHHKRKGKGQDGNSEESPQELELALDRRQEHGTGHKSFSIELWRYDDAKYTHSAAWICGEQKD